MIEKQFPAIAQACGGKINETIVKGMWYDLEFQTPELKRELREYMKFFDEQYRPGNGSNTLRG